MAGPVTILGASGFVGRRLLRRLEADGREVYAPRRDEDVLGRDLGSVLYLAGLTADYDARPFDTVEAHASLVSELIRGGRFDRLVYASSTRLYDGQAQGRETDPLSFQVDDPRRVYDLSKALGENLTLARTDGRGAVARLANVYDWEPGSPGFLSEWLIQASGSRRLSLNSSPHIARDYIHLDDVVDALVALEGAAGAGVVNVASGELVTNAAIAKVFEAHGWVVSFDGEGRWPSPPRCEVSRLAALGVSPRRVEDVVARHLSEIAA